MRRNRNRSSWIGHMFVVVLFAALFYLQSFEGGSAARANDSSEPALRVVDITLSNSDVPFLLDNRGHVWAFKRPFSREGLIKLPNLQNIRKIAPWIALDKDGHVFTWYLDKKTCMPAPDVVEAVYTTPQFVKELGSVTAIASGGRHFIAVRNDREILEWSGILSEDGFGFRDFTPVKILCTHPGVRDISASDGSALALFWDGVILGWGLNDFGQTRKAKIGRQISFNVPGAVSVFLNSYHAAVLLKDGQILFWGGCSLGEDSYFKEHLPSSAGLVNGAYGQVTGVATMALSDNDNETPNVFLKHDGSVWRAYAPLPSEFSDRRLGCGIVRCPDQEDFTILLGRDIASRRRGISQPGTVPVLCPNEKSWQLIGMDVPAVAVRTNRTSVLALGLDHSLWQAGNEGILPNQKFTRIPIKLKEE